MKKDWVGLWFQISSERGHSDEVPCYYVDLKSGHADNYSFRHRDMDGHAVLTSYLPKYTGAKFAEPPKKIHQKAKRPGFWRECVLVFKALLTPPKFPKPEWREHELENTSKPDSLIWLHFNEVAGEALLTFTKNRKISAGAYLLHKISAEIRQQLSATPASFQGAWMLPVTIRAGLKNDDGTGNKVSYIPISYGPSVTAEHIQANIKDQLSRQQHWANWLIYNIGRVVGLRGMRYLSKRASQRSFWLGSFTDLGDWTPVNAKEHDELRQKIWLFAPPGSPNNPVGGLSFSWFGQRSLTLRIHPSICPQQNTEITEKILAKIAADMAQELGVARDSMKIHEAGMPF